MRKLRKTWTVCFNCISRAFTSEHPAVPAVLSVQPSAYPNCVWSADGYWNNLENVSWTLPMNVILLVMIM